MPRYGIYWAPAQGDPLWQAGAGWLGRDPCGQPVLPSRMPDFPYAAEITEAPRLYGFHATLKPPMRLHTDVTRADLLATLHTVAASVPEFDLPRLAVSDWHGFLCLRETAESAALQSLADAMVAGLDHLRAPLSERALARRRGTGLSGPREANLTRWGYPDVFATWFFHMTLTRRLVADELAAIRPIAEAWFAPFLAATSRVRDVCVFEQPGKGLPFRVSERVRLGGKG